MRFYVPNATKETRKGKRSIRTTKWGNVNAHISGKFWKTIGPQYGIGVDEDAQAFLDGKDD